MIQHWKLLLQNIVNMDQVFFNIQNRIMNWKVRVKKDKDEVETMKDMNKVEENDEVNL
jgi:hypothetical protein